MNVDHVEILVEEPSMEAALRVILPKVLGELSFEIRPFQCKAELLQRLPSRMLAYASYIPETWRIVVIVDRDNDDCSELKAQLEKIASDAGLRTRSKAVGNAPYVVVNRVAIEELEAWYFGDWVAVRQAYPKVSETIPLQAKYRNADAIKGGTWEAFERVLQKAGYFVGGLRKTEAARAVSKHMDPSRNTSPSFCALRDALLQL
jgi:hypothetical protein